MTAQIHGDLLERCLQRADWKISENANMAFSLQGLNNYVASEVTHSYWLDRVYSEAVRDAHREGALHLHDLNALAVYCVGWDLSDLLLSGFRGAPGHLYDLTTIPSCSVRPLERNNPGKKPAIG